MKSLLFLVGGLALGYASGFLMIEDAASEAVLLDRRARGGDPGAKPHSQREEVPPSTASAVNLQVAGSLILPDLHVDEVATGDGRIAGLVKDLHGNPVADVRLRLTHNKEYSSSLYGQHRDNMPFDEYLREFARREMYRRSSMIEAYTDEEGRFQLTGLAEIPYRLAAYKEGFKFSPERPASALWSDLKPGAEVVLVAKTNFQLEMHLLKPDGSTPAKFQFKSTRTEFGSTHNSTLRWSASKPRVEMEEGLWTLTAAPSEEWRCDPVKVHVVEGIPLNPVTVTLHPRRGIKGTIVPAEGTIAKDLRSGVGLFVRWMRDDRAQSTVEDLVESGKSEHVWMRQGGGFQLMDLDQGDYLMGAFDQRLQRVGEVKRVTLGEGITTVILEAPRVDESESLSIHIRDPKGAPLAGCSVQLMPKSSTLFFGGQNTAQPGKTPGHWIVPFSDQWKKDGVQEATLYTSHPLYGSQETTVNVEVASEITVTMKAPASLTVNFSFPGTDEERSGWKLALHPKSVVLFRMQQLVEDMPQGADSVEFTGIGAGDYRLALVETHSSGMLSSNSGYQVAEFSLMEGEAKQLTVSLPRMGSLRVTEIPGQTSRVSLLAVGGPGDQSSHLNAKINGERTAHFRRVPFGRYTLSLHRHGGMEVQVSGETEVVFAKRAMVACEVSVSKPDGALAQAGFRDGDQVLALDGELLAETDLTPAMLDTLLYAGREAHARVRRGGKVVTIQYDGRKFAREARRGARLGGSLKPVY